MKLTMKPETIARRTLERAAETAARKANHLNRLVELVQRDGVDSIWVELLAEHQARLSSEAV